MSSGADAKVKRAEFKTKTNLPVKDESHSYVLVNLSNAKLMTRTRSPGIRILGAFETVDAARRFAVETHGKGGHSVYCSFLQKFKAICETVERQNDAKYSAEHAKRLVEIYTKIDEASRKKLSAATTGDRKKPSDELEERKQKVRETLQSVEQSKTGLFAKALSADKCLPGQNFAVVVFLTDIRQEVLKGKAQPETAFAIMGIFGDADKALEYAKAHTSKMFPQLDVSVVKMYEWLYPEEVDSGRLRNVYPDEIRALLTK